MVNVLLANGADAHQSMRTARLCCVGQQFAAGSDRLDAVSALLARGARVEIFDSDGWITLYLTALHNNGLMLKLLLVEATLVNVASADELRDTSLFITAANGATSLNADWRGVDAFALLLVLGCLTPFKTHGESLVSLTLQSLNEFGFDVHELPGDVDASGGVVGCDLSPAPSDAPPRRAECVRHNRVPWRSTPIRVFVEQRCHVSPCDAERS